MHKILFLDDEIEILKSIKRLYHNFFDIVIEINPQKAIKLIKNDKDISVVVTDINMPKMDGYKFLENISNTNVIKVIMTGEEIDTLDEDKIKNLNVFKIITKPCGIDTMISVISDSIKEFELNRDKPKSSTPNIVNFEEIIKFINPYFEKNSKIILKNDTNITEKELSIISLITQNINISIENNSESTKSTINFINKTLNKNLSFIQLYLYIMFLKDFPLYKINETLSKNYQQDINQIDKLFEPYKDIMEQEFDDNSIITVSVNKLQKGDRILNNIESFDEKHTIKSCMKIFDETICKEIFNLSKNSILKDILIKR